MASLQPSQQLRELAHGAALRAQATTVRPNTHSQFMADFTKYELSVGQARQNLAEALSAISDLLPEKPASTNSTRLAKGLARELNFASAAQREMRIIGSFFNLDSVVSRFRIDYRSVARGDLYIGNLLDGYRGTSVTSNPISTVVISLARAMDKAAIDASRALPRRSPMTLSKAATDAAKRAKAEHLSAAFQNSKEIGYYLNELEELVDSITEGEGWKRSERIVEHSSEIRRLGQLGRGLEALEINEREFLDDWRAYLSTDDGKDTAALLGYRSDDVRSVVREVSRIEGLPLTLGSDQAL